VHRSIIPLLIPMNLILCNLYKKLCIKLVSIRELYYDTRPTKSQDKDECLFVCLYVCLYLIQIHISEPIGTKLCTHLLRGLEETIRYVWAHNISPFPLFRPILPGAGADSCAVDDCRCHIALLLRYIHDAARDGVTSRTVGCAMKTRRSEQNACVKMET